MKFDKGWFEKDILNETNEITSQIDEKVVNIKYEFDDIFEVKRDIKVKFRNYSTSDFSNFFLEFLLKPQITNLCSWLTVSKI